MTAPRQAPARRTPVRGEMLPPDLICLPLGTGCLLLLTATEYTRALRRGKWWRRHEALTKRTGARP